MIAFEADLCNCCVSTSMGGFYQKHLLHTNSCNVGYKTNKTSIARWEFIYKHISVCVCIKLGFWNHLNNNNPTKRINLIIQKDFPSF